MRQERKGTVKEKGKLNRKANKKWKKRTRKKRNEEGKGGGVDEDSHDEGM